MRARWSPLTVLLAAAVAESVLWAGGFGPPARITFVVLALLALAAAGREAPDAVAALVRRPVVVVLVVLGVLGACSAAWTVASPADALRWGAVTLGYAAVAVAAGVRARRPGGVAALAAGIAALAFVSGVVGLVGVVVQHGPFADRIGGSWRPGGTLEYSAALALLQVSALPALLSGLRSPAVGVRAAAAAGGAVCGAVLVLSGSRLALAMALIVLLVWALRAPRSSPGQRRGRIGVVAGLVLAGAVVVGATWSGAGHGLWHGRPAVWRVALDVFSARPLAGAGADSFLVASLPHVTHGDPVAFAHDLPLELGAELGLPGLLLALALYVTAGRAVWAARGTRGAWLLGPAVVAFLVAGLVDWPWHLAGSGAVWALALGGLLAADTLGPPGKPVVS